MSLAVVLGFLGFALMQTVAVMTATQLERRRCTRIVEEHYCYHHTQPLEGWKNDVLKKIEGTAPRFTTTTTPWRSP